jgi:hypothetical protein
MKNKNLFYFFPLGDENYKFILFLPPGGLKIQNYFIHSSPWGMKNTNLYYFIPHKE